PSTQPTGDAVFLLDTSLSQRGALGPSCGKLLRAILERDETIRRFRVVAFDVSARDLTSGWRANTAKDRESALDAVEHVWLEGATSVEAALDHLDRSVGPDEHP